MTMSTLKGIAIGVVMTAIMLFILSRIKPVREYIGLASPKPVLPNRG